MRKISFIFLLLLFGAASQAAAQTATPTVTSTNTVTPTPTPSQICCSPANPWVTPAVTASAGVAVDTGRSRVYITDNGTPGNPGLGKVRALKYDGTTDTSFGTSGSVSVAGAFEVAVGKGAYDGVYVLQRDNGMGVTKLDSSGNVIWARSPGIAGSWRAICVDDWGNVYAATDISGIIVWDNNGNQQSPTFSTSFNAPSGLFSSGLSLYVSDTANYRILQFVQTGVNTYAYNLTQAATLGGSWDPYGITEDLTGHFYINIKTWNGFAAFDSNFNQSTQPCSGSSMQGCYGIALDETGAVYIGANVSNKVTKIQACYLQPASPTPTPTPSYRGLNPPGSGECFIYPSPAKGNQATVSYNMVGSGRVELKIWNERAELVYDVTDQKSAGVQVTPFSIARFTTGVYFYGLTLTYDSGQVEQVKPHKFVVIH